MPSREITIQRLIETHEAAIEAATWDASLAAAVEALPRRPGDPMEDRLAEFRFVNALMAALDRRLAALEAPTPVAAAARKR